MHEMNHLTMDFFFTIFTTHLPLERNSYISVYNTETISSRHPNKIRITINLCQYFVGCIISIHHDDPILPLFHQLMKHIIHRTIIIDGIYFYQAFCKSLIDLVIRLARYAVLALQPYDLHHHLHHLHHHMLFSKIRSTIRYKNQ